MSKRALAVLMTAGLIGGLLAAPADAQRRKQRPPQPVPVEVDYFLRADDGCSEPSDWQLKLEPSEDGSNCGSFDMGLPNEILIMMGEEPTTRTYTATEGVPLILDATKEITGMIGVSSWAGASAGPTTLVITVLGTIDGEEQVIGETQESYTVGPGVHEIEFTIEEIDEDLHRKELESLAVDLYNRGVAPTHGYYRSHTPHSYVTMPTIEMRRR